MAGLRPNLPDWSITANRALYIKLGEGNCWARLFTNLSDAVEIRNLRRHGE
jgi:hypothetical protein